MSKTQFLTAPVRAFFTLLLLSMAVFWPAPLAMAQPNTPPERMTYQGFLADSSGAPLGTNAPRNYDVIFRIMGDQQNGPLLWAEQQTVTVDKGYFSVLLGEGTQITSPLEPHPPLSTLFRTNTASERYVEMTVKGIGTGGSDVTILPRLRLLTSPYSFLSQRAISAASLDDGAQIIGGVVNDARLSGNVALRAGGNSFTGNQTISGNVGIGTVAPVQRLDVRGNINLGHWTENFVTRRIGIMDGVTTHTAGMEIENTTLGGNYSQKLHLLTHHYAGTYGRRLTIDEDGKVGIGTTNPIGKLTIDEDNTAGRTLVLRKATEPNKELYLGWDSDGDYGSIQAYFQNFAPRNMVLQQAGGNVGIGNSDPARRLTVETRDGTAQFRIQDLSSNRNAYWEFQVFPLTAKLELKAWDVVVGNFHGITGSYSATSDRRLKQDIEPLKHMLQSALKMKPVVFRFKSAPGEKHKSMGFISQDVEELFPGAVTERSDGTKGLTYTEIIPVAIGAIQELKAEMDMQVKKLSAENSTLRERLDAQEQRLAQLEAKEKARDAKFASIEQMLRSPDQPGVRPVSLLKVSAAE